MSIEISKTSSQKTTEITLNNLPKSPWLKNKKRVGRGAGSKGKTSGRGMNGYGARNGNVSPTFEGGQTRFWQALPYKGMKRTPPKKKIFEINGKYLNINNPTIEDLKKKYKIAHYYKYLKIIGNSKFIQFKTPKKI